MAAEDALPQMLVVGPSGAGKTVLTRAIVSSPSDADGGVQWAISNKYYSARVAVQELGPDGAGPGGSNMALPEALVLVFSLTQPSSLPAAQALISALDLEAVEVKLLVGTHADVFLGSTPPADLEAAAQPDWFQEALDWAVLNGFELIVCSTTEPGVDAQLQLDGDRQGVARVTEALHSHTWPGLQLCGEASGAPSAPAAASGLRHDSDGLSAERAEGTCAAATPEAEVDQYGSDAEAASEPGPQAAALHRGGGAEATPSRLAAAHGGSALSHAHPPGTGAAPRQASSDAQQAAACEPADASEDGADVDERAMDDLERLMTDVLSERGGHGRSCELLALTKCASPTAASCPAPSGMCPATRAPAGHKERLAGMPDEQRRESAATLALRMAVILGLGDETDDDD